MHQLSQPTTRWWPNRSQPPSRRSSSSSWDRTKRKSPATFSARHATGLWPAGLPWWRATAPTYAVALFAVWGVAVLASYPGSAIISKMLSTTARFVTPFSAFARKLEKAHLIKLWFSFSFKPYFLSKLSLNFVLFLYKLWFYNMELFLLYLSFNYSKLMFIVLLIL